MPRYPGIQGPFATAIPTAGYCPSQSELVKCGATPAEIAVHLYENRAYEEVDLMRAALDTLGDRSQGRDELDLP